AHTQGQNSRYASKQEQHKGRLEGRHEHKQIKDELCASCFPSGKSAHKPRGIQGCITGVHPAVT
ncbi:MAG: hypothetical protein AB7S62_02175, partial [Azoarcus sp.]